MLPEWKRLQGFQRVVFTVYLVLIPLVLPRSCRCCICSRTSPHGRIIVVVRLVNGILLHTENQTRLPLNKTTSNKTPPL